MQLNHLVKMTWYFVNLILILKAVSHTAVLILHAFQDCSSGLLPQTLCI